MTFDYRSLFASGLMPMPGSGYIVVTLALTQITIAAVTIYLHRGQAHHALELHPVISHFFRFWLWLTTGMVTKAWVAIHCKHHAKVGAPDDPHGPQVHGIQKVFWDARQRAEASNIVALQSFARQLRRYA